MRMAGIGFRGAASVASLRDALAQADLVEIRRVLAEGLFGPGAAFGVVEEHLRRAAAVQAFQVVDIGDHRHGADLFVERADTAY